MDPVSTALSQSTDLFDKVSNPVRFSLRIHKTIPVNGILRILAEEMPSAVYEFSFVQENSECQAYVEEMDW